MKYTQKEITNIIERIQCRQMITNYIMKCYEEDISERKEDIKYNDYYNIIVDMDIDIKKLFKLNQK